MPLKWTQIIFHSFCFKLIRINNNDPVIHSTMVFLANNRYYCRVRRAKRTKTCSVSIYKHKSVTIRYVAFALLLFLTFITRFKTSTNGLKEVENGHTVNAQ